MHIDAFSGWFILSVSVGMIIIHPIIFIMICQCARFAIREQEERRYRTKEEIYIGIGEFIAFLLEYTVAFLENYYDTDFFFRPIFRQIKGWDYGWAVILLLFVSLYLFFPSFGQ